MAGTSRCSVILVLTDLRLILRRSEQAGKGVRIVVLDAAMRRKGAKSAGLPVLFGWDIATDAFDYSLGCTAFWRRKHGG
jgi:hypothetical protein